MQTKREWTTGTALFLAALLIVLLPSGARSSRAQTAAQSQEPVPDYHPQPPAGALPDTMDPAQFENPVVKNAYALAAKVKKVLYQQPCYCYCDRSVGHKSLLDCFASEHGSQCDICQKEAVLAYQQTLKGKTPAQIRAAIIRGDWKSVDMKPYMNAATSR